MSQVRHIWVEEGNGIGEVGYNWMSSCDQQSGSLAGPADGTGLVVVHPALNAHPVEHMAALEPDDLLLRKSLQTDRAHLAPALLDKRLGKYGPPLLLVSLLLDYILHLYHNGGHEHLPPLEHAGLPLPAVVADAVGVDEQHEEEYGLDGHVVLEVGVEGVYLELPEVGVVVEAGLFLLALLQICGAAGLVGVGVGVVLPAEIGTGVFGDVFAPEPPELLAQANYPFVALGDEHAEGYDCG